MNFIFLLLSAFAFATESQNLFEKTFGRDNSYCDFGKNRLELLIRGASKYTDLNEKGYGEYAFYRTGDDEDQRIESLAISTQQFQFRFFPGKKSACSKSLAFPLQNDLYAILFQRENRPFKGLLVIQLVHGKTLAVGNVLVTNYATNKVEPFPGGFSFVVLTPKEELDMGKAKIQDGEFIYQDRVMPYWMAYTKNGFTHLPGKTFERLPWKQYFQNEADFLKTTGWDAKEGKYLNKVIYIAVNYAIKKECLLIQAEKSKLTGSENWRCRQLM